MTLSNAKFAMYKDTRVQETDDILAKFVVTIRETHLRNKVVVYEHNKWSYRIDRQACGTKSLCYTGIKTHNLNPASLLYAMKKRPGERAVKNTGKRIDELQ